MTTTASQLSLALAAHRRWGGARPGAGRKRGEHLAMRHVARERFGRMLPAHVTVRLVAGVPSLRDVRIVRRIEKTFANGCERPDFRLTEYSLQGNHAHLIVEAADQGALARGMMAIGARLALAVNRAAGHRGRVIADRYHHHLLRTPREVQRALRYVLLNARRHAAKAGVKLAARVRLDPASSARWFEGWKKERIAVPQRDVRPPPLRPVARAKTWLLTVGWQRHGLLDPADVPG